MIFATIYIILCMIFIAFLGGMIVGAWLISSEKPQQEPCISCEYTEGSEWCIKHCPYDKDVLKEIEDVFKKNERSLCDSCVNRECIFQSGIFRNHCDFYKSESIGELPSVNPTKTGHWIDGWVNEYKTCPKVTCSECGIDGTLSYKEYKFCPNCGARMAESEEV